VASPQTRPRETGHWVLMDREFVEHAHGWPRAVADKFLCDRYPCHINAARVTDLLRQAGSPELWHNPDACGALAILDVTEPMLIREYQRAHEAIQQLLETLPVIIDQKQDALSLSRTEFGERGPNYEQLINLMKLYKLVLGVRPMLARKKRAGWHAVAYQLFNYYRKVVHPDCGHSADGPAVRFIRSALDALGLQTWSDEAIEKAVERHWRRPRHRNSAKCSGTEDAAGY
jgi:hypothetical protein